MPQRLKSCWRYKITFSSTVSCSWACVCVCECMVEIREEETRKYYQRRICQAGAVPESVSSDGAHNSIHRLRHGSSEQNVGELSCCFPVLSILLIQCKLIR